MIITNKIKRKCRGAVRFQYPSFHRVNNHKCLFKIAIHPCYTKIMILIRVICWQKIAIASLKLFVKKIVSPKNKIYFKKIENCLCIHFRTSLHLFWHQKMRGGGGWSECYSAGKTRTGGSEIRDIFEFFFCEIMP